MYLFDLDSEECASKKVEGLNYKYVKWNFLGQYKANYRAYTGARH